MNREHLKKLKRLVKRTNAPWLSDHLCWGSVDGRYTHDLLPKTIFLAVHRHNHTVYYKRLQPGPFRLLRALQAKATLAEACEQLAESGQEDLAQVKTWFECWAALGWFRKLE